MKTVMVATDFSERSDRALRRATLLARQFGASLSLVHVVDDDQPQRIVDSEREAASALMKELRSTVTEIDGISCETRIVIADPFAGIARAAEEEAPDLLVIGPHRRQMLRDVFVGTTAERTVRSVSVPVLMVNAPPVGPYRQVLLATDLSEGAERAAKACLELGIADGASASFLHVYETPAKRLVMSHAVPTDDWEIYLTEMRKEAGNNFAAFANKFDMDAPHQILRRGLHAPAEEILATARDVAAELVVMGTHGRSGIEKFFLGSVAEAVLRKAEFDVLAVPPSTIA